MLFIVFMFMIFSNKKLTTSLVGGMGFLWDWAHPNVYWAHPNVLYGLIQNNFGSTSLKSFGFFSKPFGAEK